MRFPIVVICLLALTAHAADKGSDLRGYTSADSAVEVKWEQTFRSLPDPDHIRENMRRLSAYPHHVGSAYDKNNAEWLLAPRRAD
jgi:N-acetylated-alpha-linked acidic dipeptidase